MIFRLTPPFMLDFHGFPDHLWENTAATRAPFKGTAFQTRRTPWPMPYSRPAWVLGLWGCWLHSTRALRCSPTSLATQQLAADPKIVFFAPPGSESIYRTIGESTMRCGGYKYSLVLYILMGLYIQRILYVVNPIVNHPQVITHLWGL